MSAKATTERTDSRQSMHADDRESTGDNCPGCNQLAERIEHLEQRLAANQSDGSPAKLSATGCYWICLAVHVFVTFCLFGIESGGQHKAYFILGGAASTISICHVFSVRPLHQKMVRNFFAIAVVVATAFLLPRFAEMELRQLVEVLGFVWVVAPLIFVSPWLVAKIFVWTLGWRLVPPGFSEEIPELRISHLLLLTATVAGYLAVGRFLIGDLGNFFDGGMVGLALSVFMSTTVCGLFCCVLARIMLRPNNSNAIKHTTYLVITGGVVSSSILSLLVFRSAAPTTETISWFLTYVLLAMLGLFGSSSFSFLMMRFAEYRLVATSDSRVSPKKRPI